MDGDMEKCEVKKVAGPIEGGAAIFLGNAKKTFMIFVGLFEASAIVKEIQNQQAIRPLTHDLLYHMLLGFDIEVKRVIISSIVDNTFCATLVLEQKVKDQANNWTGKRNEVHIDARASDSIIIALKARKDIWVTRDVFDKVEDISDQLEALPQEEKEKWQGTEIPNMEFKVPDYLPEDEEEDDEETP